jgi:hypothetical protein
MNEMFPITAGMVVGVLLRGATPSRRRFLVAALGFAFGLLASLLSGELRMGWGFVIVDTLLVVIVAESVAAALRHFDSELS